VAACKECGSAKGHLFGCSQVPAGFTAEARPEPTSDAHIDKSDDSPYLFAFPLAFVSAVALVSTSVGGFIGRTCFGMWLHEFGHATAAWLSGRFAVPSPWFTSISDGHSWPTTVVVFGGLLALGWWSFKTRRWGVTALCGLLVLVALVLHTRSKTVVDEIFTFSGDAGSLVFGAGLAAAFLLSPDLRLTRRGLRWGWLLVGSMSWADTTLEWVRVKRDPTQLGFGVQEGTLSDTSKLVDTHHWPEDLLVGRYLSLSAATFCIVFAWWCIRLRVHHQRSQ
jgi:hypothetical protein